ncbi:MAG TPA: TRAP transporter substrate-binding protein DctP [Burkholderiales bacterium]|nr:TRAP transporter substrate-binding protein DctP [Burkholderiales bacterium]
MWHRLLHASIIGALALLTAGNALAHGVTLDLRHPLPADSAFHTQFLQPWVDKVQKASGGRLHFHVHAADKDSAPATLFDQVKEAKADVVWTALCYTPERFSALEVFELPLLTKNTLGASRAMWEYVRMSDAAQNELDGVRLLAIHQAGPAVFHMRNKSIAKADDLKGLKIGAATPAARRFLAHAGATPVDLPYGSAKSLSATELDGALLGWESAPYLAGNLSAKFHSELASPAARLDAPVFVLLMNAGTYKSLPDDLKKLIQDHSGADTITALVKAFEDSAKGARQAAADRGEAINAIPAEEVAKWQSAVQAATNEWIKSADKRGASGKELVEAAKEALQAFDKAD